MPLCVNVRACVCLCQLVRLPTWFFCFCVPFAFTPPTVLPHPEGGSKALESVVVYVYVYSCGFAHSAVWQYPGVLVKGPKLQQSHTTAQGYKNATKPQMRRAIATKRGTPPPPVHAGRWQDHAHHPAINSGGNTAPHGVCLQRFHSAHPNSKPKGSHQ